MTMEHISQTLKDVIKDIEGKQFSPTNDVFRLFKKNLASRERRHAQCSALRNGILTVNVDSSVWLYQLNLKKEGLLKKLGIKDIRFKIGDLK